MSYDLEAANVQTKRWWIRWPILIAIERRRFTFPGGESGRIWMACVKWGIFTFHPPRIFFDRDVLREEAARREAAEQA